jgi:hypothetical protein
MTNRTMSIAHGILAVANLFMAIVCVIVAIAAFNANMMPLFFLDCSLFVANIAMAVFNYQESRK